MMMAKQTISGPYKVINIGAEGQVYEVVERVSEQGDYEELRPRKTYLKRQSAYGMMARLNRRWQEEHMIDEAEYVTPLSMEEEDAAYYEQYQ